MTKATFTLAISAQVVDDGRGGESRNRLHARLSVYIAMTKELLWTYTLIKPMARFATSIEISYLRTNGIVQSAPLLAAAPMPVVDLPSMSTALCARPV
jgi:hypothetical protein